MATGAVFLVFVWSALLNIVTSITFPEPGETPIIAVLEFKQKLNVFNPEDPEGSNERISLKGRGASTGLEFNYRTRDIYFTDLFRNQIYSLKADGRDQNQTLIADYDGLSSPEGLAYDWIHNNLYVCLWGDNHIDVIKPDTGEQLRLINTTKPRDIQVDPRTGWMYFIGGWEDTARLVRCGLDGQNEEELNADISRPFSLSLDYDENRLYWTEKFRVNKIYSIGVNGEDQRIFFDAGRSYDHSPYYVTVTTEYVYWTAGFESRVNRRRKHSGTTIQRFNSLEIYGRFNIQENLFTGILAIDPLKQPDTANLRGENNGGCSHFCLPSPVDLELSPSYTCHCPNGRDLDEDAKTCMQ